MGGITAGGVGDGEVLTDSSGQRLGINGIRLINGESVKQDAMRGGRGDLSQPDVMVVQQCGLVVLDGIEQLTQRDVIIGRSPPPAPC